MLVLYYFQGEVGESLEQPNAFMLSGEKITFQDFLKGFPDKNTQKFRFRFRKEDDLCGYVWLDISNPSEVLPLYNGVVTAKILKIDSLSTQKRVIYLKPKKQFVDELPVFAPKEVPPPLPPKPKPAPAPASSVSEGSQRINRPPENGSARAPAPSSAKVSPPPQPKATTPPPNIFDDEPHSPFHKQEEPNLWGDAKTASTTSNSQPDILNFDDHSYNPIQGSKKSSGGDSDMLFFSTTPSKKSVAPSRKDAMSSSGIDIDETNPNAPLDRAQLAQKREDHISEKVQNALEFKKEMDSKKEKELQDFDQAREKHEKALLAWSTNNKEKRNIRNLLSTMHTVLPEGTKWKAISLGDVLEPRQVKLQYRKAMLVVHPDHTLNLDPESKFICKRIFEAVNEAWDDFSKKEGL